MRETTNVSNNGEFSLDVGHLYCEEEKLVVLLALF